MKAVGSGYNRNESGSGSGGGAPGLRVVAARPQIGERDAGSPGDGRRHGAAGLTVVDDVGDELLLDAQKGGEFGLVQAALDQGGVDVGGVHGACSGSGIPTNGGYYTHEQWVFATGMHTMSGLDFEAVVERLKAALGLKSDAQVAKALGMKPNAFSNRMVSGSVPYEEIVTASAMLDFDLVEVLTGSKASRVVSLRSDSAENSLRTEEPGPSGGYQVQQASDFVEVPLYDVRAAAGFGAFIHDESVVEALAFRRDWIARQFGSSPRDLRLIYVMGDSMEPVLSDGDVVLIDRMQREPREGLYVLRFDDSLVIKKLQRLPGAMIKIFSENAAYEPVTMPAAALTGDGVELIGRVMWAGHKF